MLLRLGNQFLLSDRSVGGQPGRAHNVSGWGIPAWGPGRMRNPVGPMKPMPIGARYFCGDCDSVKENEPVAFGHKFGASKAEYQDAVTAHYGDNHPDLHYPIDQPGLDAMAKAKRHAQAILETQSQLKELAAWNKKQGVGGGIDVSGSYLPVSRVRELPDFTEFDFPDSNVADAAVEEIELDQLISIQARQGRRMLGVEIQNLGIEIATEYLTIASGADHEMTSLLELNTRTGGFNLDDPENLWRHRVSMVVSISAATEVTQADLLEINDLSPGGVVYVAPRLFWRFSNELDRQVDTGDLMTRIATINQPLSTFLLFELLEQFSGLFGLT